MSCTECGRKGGCSTRKGAMFGALDEILARLYPDRRWGHRDEAAALDAGISPEEGEALAQTIAAHMDVAARFVAGDPDEWCDYIYVLCLGRAPGVIDLLEADRERREPRAPPGVDEGTTLVTAAQAEEEPHFPAVAADGWPNQPDAGGEPEGDDLSDLYLRLVLSSVARVVGVQEVRMRLRRLPDGRGTLVTESVRGGVFDPILLRRFQALVGLLSETDLRHVDFGEIVEPPPHFDAGDHARALGFEPAVANYLFSPRPVATEVTVLVGDVAVPPEARP